MSKAMNDEDATRKLLEEEISELRSVKKVVLECSRSFNDVLERIAQRERECDDKLRRLTTETHDREKHEQAIQRLVVLDAELKHVKAENQVLKRKLLEASSETKQENVDSTGARELQKQLSQTTRVLHKAAEDLRKTRQRLSEVQERLTLSQQVTAATQQRERQESDNSEQLHLELNPQPTTRSGDFCIS